ncbi:LAFA_0A04280g1_1 [Lachancea sp. 'fantastica']|nr:LAFA_0A04280g1_1 [Lachancea sp. 'fantastica']
MASPIFLSKAHPGYSVQAFRTGFKIAVANALNFATIITDQCRLYPKKALGWALVSLFWRIAVVSIDKMTKPLFLFKYVVYALNSWLSCYILLRFNYSSFDHAFWSTFHRATSENASFEKSGSASPEPSKSKRPAMSAKLPSESIAWHTMILMVMALLMADVEKDSTTGIAVSQFGRAKLSVLTALWYTLLATAFDSVTALAISAALSTFVSLPTSIAFIAQICYVTWLTKVLLVPYMQLARFSPTEYSVWLRARGGVICGFLAPFYVLLLSSNSVLVSPAFVYVLVYPFAYLLAKIAEPVPVNALLGTKAHSTWCARQVLWRNVVSGDDFC